MCLSSSLETECLFGETITILDNYLDWYYCKLLTDNYCGWVQKKYLGELSEIFGPIPIRTTPQFDREIGGITGLSELADLLFGAESPAEFFYDELPFAITSPETDDEAPFGADQLLILSIPTVDKEDVKLNQVGEELIIEVGRYRRNMLLPRSLQTRDVLSAKLSDGSLKIWFGGRTNG